LAVFEDALSRIPNICGVCVMDACQLGFGFDVPEKRPSPSRWARGWADESVAHRSLPGRCFLLATDLATLLYTRQR
jgi:hypothetical protein